MGKLRPLPPRKVIKVIEKNGFKFIKQEGSHAKYKHDDGRWTVIPIHEIILKGTLHSIIKKTSELVFRMLRNADISDIKQTRKPREEFLD